MKRKTETVWSACGLFACALAIIIASEVSFQGQTPPQLAGKWLLNVERSEDAREKLEEALRKSGIIGRRTGSVGPNRDARDLEREQTRRRIEALIEASETLEITQDEKGVTISEGNIRERKFSTDGRPYQREDRRGNRLTVRARWRGERLIVDTKFADGNRLSEFYELAPGGRQLIVMFTSMDSRLKQPLVINRVYDAMPSDND